MKQVIHQTIGSFEKGNDRITFKKEHNCDYKNITCEYQNEIGKFISVERLEPLKNVVAVTRRMLVNHETM